MPHVTQLATIGCQLPGNTYETHPVLLLSATTMSRVREGFAVYGQECVRRHQIWSTTDQAESLLKATSPTIPEEADGLVAKLRYVLASVKGHQGADSAPYSVNMLTTGLAAVQDIESNLTNFQANPNIQYLQSAAASGAEQALNALGTWPVLSAKGGAAQLANRTFEEYRRVAEETISHLLERMDDLEQARVEREQSFRTLEQEAEVASASLRQRLDQIDTRITADEGRLDTALTTNNQMFTETQTKREERFNEWLVKEGEDLKARTEPYLVELAGAKSSAETVLAGLETLRDKTEKVAGQAAGAVLARDYASYANREWLAGVSANIVGFGALVAGFWFIASAVASLGANDAVTWQFVALKLGLTATIVTAAAVAISLGRLFLSRANTAKRVELELRAIGPFLADVDDTASAQNAKIAFVERMFGRAWEEHHANGKDGEVVDATAFEKIVDAVLRLSRGPGA